MSSGLAKTILHGTAKRKQRGKLQKKTWEDNIIELTGMDFVTSGSKAGNHVV